MEHNDSKNSHWQSLDELHQTPEYLDRKGKEFPAPPDEQSVTEMERRTFLKLMGASLLLTSTVACRRPTEKIIPYLNRPLEITTGVPNWYTSTCRECSGACGILVKTREGRPLKIEGNPEHPMNRGGLCSRGQVAVLNQYDPERFKTPGIFKDGKFSEITWSQLDSEVMAKLEEVKQSGKSVAVLTGVLTSPSTTKLIQDFLSVYPGVHISYENTAPEEIALGRELTFGQKIVPHYAFDKAALVVSFGADFLGTWLSPVEFSKQFAASRKPDSGQMTRLVVLESALSLTGSNADDYLPVKSGNEVAIALALLGEIIQTTTGQLGQFLADVQTLTNAYPLEKIAQENSLDLGALKKLAQSMIAAKGKGLILGGAVRGANAVALQVAVNYLNLALENEGATIDASRPSFQASSSLSDLQQLAKSIESGNIGALLVYKSNPVYDSPLLTLKEGLKNIPLVISFADRPDETASASHYVASASTSMEAWDDASPRAGLLSLVQPTINPLFDTRAFQDSLLKWSSSTSASWYDYIQSNWKSLFNPSTSGFATFDDLWTHMLQKGFLEVPLSGNRSTVAAKPSSLSIFSQLEEAPVFSLSLYPSVSLLDGRSAHNAFLQELPDPLSKITWENYFSVSPFDAKAYQLSEGSVVKVYTPQGTLELPVHIQPKLKPGNVMAAVGYGRKTSLGEVYGKNASVFQKISGDSLVWGGLNIIDFQRTGVIERFGITQGHHELEGRNIVQQATLADFQKDSHAGASGHHGAIPSMWSEHEYNGYRWGMAIDMTACTGCNACMVACQIENNVPVVGKEQVFRGRDMHWMRIDRYYSGDENNPDIVYQPMLCQQCENAPCETVCPVLATVHDDDGINVMVYNRCVGTRYCSNNCPYKVRRFNYFDYWKGIKAPAHLALNPEMSVRTRGVMEKCNFCIQRIRTAKDLAKDDNRKVRDGEIKVACEQTCPSSAIVFGDLNDPKSQVSLMKQSPRGYHVLDELNVLSRVTYLRKIRNKEEV